MLLRRSSVVLGVTIMVGAATACGGDGPPEATTSTTSTLTTAPPTTTTVPLGRTVSLGETFSVGMGETVSVQGDALSVTYSAVGSDSRCRPGWRCVVAGDATITVTVAKAGTPPATLDLNTDAPRSVRYGRRSVELMQLGFGRPPVARLRVT